MSSETASVYMEIGVQAGILLMVDMIKNMSVEKQKEYICRKKENYENIKKNI